MKKLIAILLLAALTMSQAAFAPIGEPSETPPLSTVYVSGSVINESGNTIEIKNVNQDGSTIILNITDETYVVDSVTGKPVSFKDRVGEYVAAYHSPVTTRSMPPISNAVLIMVNIPQDYMLPHYARVESVTKKDKAVIVVIDGASLRVIINEDTPVTDSAGNAVSTDDIAAGTDLLLWYPFVALSWPAQATATKVVVLGKGEAPEIEIVRESEIIGDDEWICIMKNTGFVPGGSSVPDITGQGIMPIYPSSSAPDETAKGNLPSFSGAGNISLVGVLNKKRGEVYNSAMSKYVLYKTSTGRSADIVFSYEIFTTPKYTSVVIRSEVNDGEFGFSDVDTFVFRTNPVKPSSSKLCGLTDILGERYAYILANAFVKRGIAAVGATGYEYEFNGVTPETNFYINNDGDIVIIFDQYEIASRDAGTPEFILPLP